MNVVTLTLGPLDTNCYLVWSGSDGDALLVDCAGDPEAILGEARGRELRIRLIVNTHGHIDHTDALAAVVRATLAQVAVHELDASFLADPALSGAALFGFSQAAVTPQMRVREGDTVSLERADLSLKVLHTPGHTPGSICLVSEGVLFSGDTLFAGGIGRMDLPGGDEAAMMSSLSRLMELPGDLVVYPGHGPATTIREERARNPWIGER